MAAKLDPVEIERYKGLLAGMDPQAKAKLDTLIKEAMTARWLPDHRNVPQMVAYESRADIMLYGGAAGGGKTDLLLGLALTKHLRTVVFRAQYTDLKGIEDRLLTLANNGGREGYNGQDKVLRTDDGRLIELGAIGSPGQELSWMGRPHDLIGFDEAAQLPAEKVKFVMGWLRTSVEGQRTRVVMASNPPIGGEGEWLIEWFAPWLNPMFPRPAKPGELRWAYTDKDGKTVWVDGPDTVKIGDEEYTPLSRTFIPARVGDNPYLDKNYKAQLQSMPEPLRSKLLNGDFLAGRQDHAWQIIPTEWVRLAQARWKPGRPQGVSMLTMGVDIGGGGAGDPHVIAPLYANNWFDAVTVLQGIDAKNGPMLAGQIMMHRRDGALVCLDGTGGWAGSARDHLATNHIAVETAIFNVADGERTKDDKFKLANVRATMMWRLREALDPSSNEDIALPPDERLTAELTAARWMPKKDVIWVESKDEIRARLGGSPDRADAVMIAWYYRKQAMRAAVGGSAGAMQECVEPEDPLDGF